MAAEEGREMYMNCSKKAVTWAVQQAHGNQNQEQRHRTELNA